MEGFMRVNRSFHKTFVHFFDTKEKYLQQFLYLGVIFTGNAGSFDIRVTQVILVKCKCCGLIFRRVTNNQKYCEKCSYYVHLVYMRGYMRRRRNLGTSDFYEHRKKDFDEELLECREEIKRIGFKRQFTQKGLYISSESYLFN